MRLKAVPGCLFVATWDGGDGPPRHRPSGALKWEGYYITAGKVAPGTTVYGFIMDKKKADIVAEMMSE